VRSGIQAGLAQPDYWKQGNAATINAPQQQAANAATAANSDIGNMNGWGAAGAGNMNGWGAAGAGNMNGWGSSVGNVNGWAPSIGNVSSWGSPIGNVNGWSAPIGQVSPGGTPQMNSSDAMNYGQAAGQSTQNGWNSLGQGAGNIASSILGGKNSAGGSLSMDPSVAALL